jgi:hypothetical protein
LNNNAHINDIDFKGWTPIYYAIDGKNYDIINLLLNSKRKNLFLLHLDYNNISPIKYAINKELEHINIIIDDNYFIKKNTDKMMGELYASEVIQKNIPDNLDSILFIALFIQNEYWESTNLSDTEIKEGEKQNVNQYNKRIEQGIEIASQLGEKRNGTNFIDNLKSKVIKDEDVDGVDGMDDVDDVNDVDKDEYIYMDTIIEFYRAKVKDSKNYTNYWNTRKNRINETPHYKLLKKEKEFLSKIKQTIKDDVAEFKIDDIGELKDVKKGLEKYLGFVNFAYNQPKKLEDNLYYNFLVKLYTHIISKTIGKNMYISIKQIIVREYSKQTIKVETEKLLQYLKEIQKLLTSDRIIADNINYKYIVRFLKLKDDEKNQEDVFYDFIQILRKEDNLKIVDMIETYIIPYYIELYEIVVRNLHKTLLNYHKYIYNHYKGVTILIDLFEKIIPSD